MSNVYQALFPFLYLALFVIIAVPERQYKPSYYKDTIDSRRRVIGGELAEKHQFPYQVSIQYRRRHYCGGTLISKTRIITAAHCKIGPTFNHIVLLGLYNLIDEHEDVQRIRAKHFYIHPNYPYGAVKVESDDVAFIILSRPVSFSPAIQIARLPRNEECNVMGKMNITGWGYVGVNNRPIRMRWAELDRLTYEECATNLIRLMHTIGPLTTKMICIYDETHIPLSACSGDSGGGLIFNNTVIGTLSWCLMPCGTKDAPTVATNVCEYLDFFNDSDPKYPEHDSGYSYEMSFNFVLTISVCTLCINNLHSQ